MYRILVINPGAMSTKVSLFEDENERRTSDLPAPEGKEGVLAQYDARRDAVWALLAEWGVALSELDAVVGRGGMLSPIPGGTYYINLRMVQEMLTPGEREHASNLGVPLAWEIARAAQVPAFVVDPVSVDEFEPLARISGLPDIERRSLSHALNLKAAARRAAQTLGRRYEEVKLVVAHLGSGISVSAHRHGRMIDVNQGLDGTGPFSPERAGGLPVGDVMRMAFSGRYAYEEMFRLITRRGGLMAHLGTNDAREVERRIAAGDEHARLIYEAMAYQIAKEIGLMATVLAQGSGRDAEAKTCKSQSPVHAVVLTGNLAHSQVLVAWIRERTAWIAPVLVFPGQMEMLAMAQGALRVLRGEEKAKEYCP
ncbi:MAG: butyrate kinase [Chloroflexi bacterium]|nr:butyrate kinase [Chloroflexota bacterium]